MQKILLWLTALLLTTQAQAIQISAVGNSWTVDWRVNASTTSGLGSNLTATSSWLVSSFSSTNIVLDVSISNTTALNGLLTNADITSFGFGAPNATATLLASGSIFGMAGSGNGPQQTYPGGFKGINVCIFSSGCSGGSVKKALHAGATDSLQIMLTGNFSGGTANLVYFPLKFQTNQGSYEPGGCINGNGCSTVPEPPVLSLLVLGLFGMIVMRRRKAAYIQEKF